MSDRPVWILSVWDIVAADWERESVHLSEALARERGQAIADTYRTHVRVVCKKSVVPDDDRVIIPASDFTYEFVVELEPSAKKQARSLFDLLRGGSEDGE